MMLSGLIENNFRFETSPFKGIIGHGREGNLFRAMSSGCVGCGLKHGGKHV